MKFNEEFFDAGLYRVDTRCEKWDGCRRQYGDVLPMHVADMDFQSPPAVREALLRRAAHPTYGYTTICDDDYRAVIDFWQRRHDLTIEKSWMTMIPCVITGMQLAILAATEPGDGVILQSPVYGPFANSIRTTGRKLMDAELIRDENGRYTMDLARIESYLQDGAKMFLLCNPHNPVGRVWTRDELQALIDLLRRYDATLVSDEIHADFVYAPNVFTPALSLETTKVVSLCAASKTFNLAGLQQAVCLCKDEALREGIRREANLAGVRSGNLFALEGTRAAYQHGDDWLDGLISYLQGNFEELRRLVKEHLPQAVLTPLEGTYLAWLDLRAWGLNCEQLEAALVKAGLFLVRGTGFGDITGEGFMRFNFACPRRQLEEGILMLKVALEQTGE